MATQLQMETKHRKMEDILQELGKKIDKMIDDSQLSKVEWKKEIDQRVEEVRKNIETLETKTKEVFGDKDRWKEVEENIRKATNEFCDAVESAFKSQRKSPDDRHNQR